MNPLQEAVLVRTGIMTFVERPVGAELSINSLSLSQPHRAEEYRIELRLHCSFFVEEEKEKPFRVEEALKNIALSLYGDTIDEIHKIQYRLMRSAARDEIIRDLNKLKDKLMEVNPNEIRKL